MSAAMPSAGVAAPTGVAQGGEPMLPATTVVGSRGADAQLFDQKNALLAQNQRLSAIPGKTAQDRIKSNLDLIASIDKQLDRSAVSGFDFAAIESAVPEQFRGRVRSLRSAADTGAISMSDLTQRLQDIEKDAVAFVTKKTDYTNQDRRVAAGMFQGRAIEELNPDELMQLQNKLDEMDIQKRRAGAQSLTVQMPTESERTAGYLTTRLKNSLAQLQTAVGESPSAASPNFRAELIKYVTKSDYLKNLANPEARQRVEAAELDILDAALTLATGAAYTAEQLKSTRSTYFPTLGDKPENIRDKAKRLDLLLKDAAMTKAGRSAPSMSSEFTPMFDMNAIEAELNRRKGK
jgi:hypothetical protein